MVPCCSIHTPEFSLTVYQNANFTHIDLDGCGPGIMRMDAMLVKVFVKSERMDDYHILLEMSLNLRSLQFIGKEVGLPDLNKTISLTDM